MKKIIAAIAIMLMGASVSFAYTLGENGVNLGSGTPALNVKTSKNVYVEYTGGATSSGKNYSYVLGTYHGSGTKTYGSSSGDTKIFSAEGTAKTLPSAPADSSSSADFTNSGFTPL